MRSATACAASARVRSASTKRSKASTCGWRRNRDYYVAGEPHLDELTFRLDLRSFRDVADAFLRGELDVAHGIPPKIVSELRNDPRYRAVPADDGPAAHVVSRLRHLDARRSIAWRCGRR